MNSSVQVLTRCIPDKTTIDQENSYFSKTGFSQFFQETSEDFHVCWLETLFMCAIAFGRILVKYFQINAITEMNFIFVCNFILFFSSLFCDNPVNVQVLSWHHRLDGSNWIDYHVYHSHNISLVMKIH